jgi:hypothetical protein
MISLHLYVHCTKIMKLKKLLNHFLFFYLSMGLFLYLLRNIAKDFDINPEVE